jgi:hypothetical protein
VSSGNLTDLQLGGGFILGLDWWIDLLRAKVEILLEVEAHDLILFTSISEAAHDLAKDLAAAHVLLVQENHTI